MVSFRRFVLAIAVLALFAGLASAQVSIPGTGSGAGNLICTANVSNPTFVRAEGYAEQVGDIVIACTGGVLLAPGTPVPTANITVSLNNTFVTSRVFNSAGVSEALLLIDEPGAAPGFGAGFPLKFCSNTSQGAGPGGCATTTPTTATGFYTAVDSTGAAINAFQGTVNSNTVTFNGIPVLAPVSTGVARVFRITNVRAAVANVGGGGAFQGTGGILASVTMSNGLLVQQPSFTVASIFTGLNPSVRVAGGGNDTGTSATGSGALLQCSKAGITAAAVLRFAEGFASAFKTRVAPTSAYSGALTPPNSVIPTSAVTQNVPGVVFSGSESGLILTNPNTGNTVGLADFGTRLKATFSNIPTGVTIYVTTTNVNPTGANGSAATGATVALNSIPLTTSGTLAGLVISETAGAQGVGGGFTGFLPFLGATNSAGSSTSLVALTPDANGTATAVWEVLQTNPAAPESAEFGVYYSFTGNQLAGTPQTTPTPTVSMSFAPTVSAYNNPGLTSAPIPRFAPSSNSATILSVQLCQTSLLFPFVNSAPGFDTGIAIANTSADVSPYSTKNQTGACTLNFFGAGAGTTTSAPFPSAGGNIAPGTLNAEQVSNIRNGFTGYVIAVCNFQFAHGYALFSDTGIRNWATGYLALVLPPPGRTATESLGH